MSIVSDPQKTGHLPLNIADTSCPSLRRGKQLITGCLDYNEDRSHDSLDDVTSGVEYIAIKAEKSAIPLSKVLESCTRNLCSRKKKETVYPN